MMPLNRFMLHINNKQVRVVSIFSYFVRENFLYEVWESFNFICEFHSGSSLLFCFISLLLSIYALFDPIKKFVRICMRWHETACGRERDSVRFVSVPFAFEWWCVCRPEQTKKQSIHQCTSNEKKGNDPAKEKSSLLSLFLPMSIPRRKFFCTILKM